MQAPIKILSGSFEETRWDWFRTTAPPAETASSPLLFPKAAEYISNSNASSAVPRHERGIKAYEAAYYPPAVLISVVVTTRNEERNIADLLDSLVTQEPPLEIVVVDANSEDGTRELVAEYAARYGFIKLATRGGTRGVSRNHGIGLCGGTAVAFIDADCIANPFWLKFLREAIQGSEVVAGRTIQIGYKPFEELERVELIYEGFDITHPSANLAYHKDVLEELGGFDEWFITAEDIDLNLRAVKAGHSIQYEPGAIVYHRTRSSVYDFFRQAFWNGAGRKQLTLRHRLLWRQYKPLEMVHRRLNAWSLSRISMAMLGYVAYRFFGEGRSQSE